MKRSLAPITKDTQVIKALKSLRSKAVSETNLVERGSISYSWEKKNKKNPKQNNKKSPHTRKVFRNINCHPALHHPPTNFPGFPAIADNLTEDAFSFQRDCRLVLPI